MPKVHKVTLSHQNFDLVLSRLGLGQKHLAEKLGLSKWAVAHWGRGDEVNVPMVHWDKIKTMLKSGIDTRLENSISYGGALSNQSRDIKADMYEEVDHFISTIESDVKSESSNNFDLSHVPTEALMAEIQRRLEKK
jgi:hypothetical protein